MLITDVTEVIKLDTDVTIVGEDLLSVDTVTVDGEEATIVEQTDTELVVCVEVPATDVSLETDVSLTLHDSEGTTESTVVHLVRPHRRGVGKRQMFSRRV